MLTAEARGLTGVVRGLTVEMRGPTEDTRGPTIEARGLGVTVLELVHEPMMASCEYTRVMRQYARDAGRFRGYELGSRGYL